MKHRSQREQEYYLVSLRWMARYSVAEIDRPRYSRRHAIRPIVQSREKAADPPDGSSYRQRDRKKIPGPAMNPDPAFGPFHQRGSTQKCTDYGFSAQQEQRIVPMRHRFRWVLEPSKNLTSYCRSRNGGGDNP